ncbi:MAG: Lrp/AsnC family transcriptional regulator [Tissierellia bacterium]|nr:Lrp/AsnC family transcriptional regulator [Tissierellia bacterium]
MKFDLTTLKILSRLLKDGRATHQSLAEELNFSRPAIHQRVNKLEEEGVIKGYKADVDFHKVGLTIDAFMLVNMHTLNYNKVISKIMSFSQEGIFIEEVFRITGEKCILVRLKTSSSDRLRQLHDHMLNLKGISETNTMLVLQTESNDFNENFVENNIEK